MKRSKIKQNQRQMQQAEMIAKTQALIDAAEPVVCKCGCPYFDEVKTFKYVSAILAPNGQAGYIQVPVVVCLSCLEPLPKPGEHKTISKEGKADDKNSGKAERADSGDVGQADERAHISLDP